MTSIWVNRKAYSEMDKSVHKKYFFSAENEEPLPLILVADTLYDKRNNLNKFKSRTSSFLN
jgi:hypothetical protein